MNKKLIKTKAKELKKNIPYEISKEGSLGLLALGDIGLISWRKEREANQNQKK